MKEAIQYYKTESLKTTFAGIDVYTQQMKVKDVVLLHYVAIRGVDIEPGAVQRVLSTPRVREIREYVLSGKTFFNTFILNWTNNTYSLDYHPHEKEVSIPILRRAAQVIDGQHRIAGLAAAMEEDPAIGNNLILVTIANNLTTAQAAEIFLNINTEQKPVPKSLIFDLFGFVESDKDHSINRSTDITNELNENETSPYYKLIKFPGNRRGQGAVDMSTFVGTLSKYLEPKGTFYQYNITDLNRQKTIFLNYFKAIKFSYDQNGIWDSKNKNPFLQSSGVVAAIEFLIEKLLIKCSDKKSFSIETFREFLQLNKSELLTQQTIKNLDGKSARTAIKEYLESNLLSDAPRQEEYEF